MQIKNIENFNLQDCEEFLKDNLNSEKDNLNGELVDLVRGRQKRLMDDIFRAKRKDEEAWKEQIHSVEENIKWIDFSLFNERKRFHSYKKIRFILKCIIFICTFLICSALYYVNTFHAIYDTGRHAQAEYTTGIEYVLLIWGLIEPNYYVYSIYMEGTFQGFLIIGILSVIILLISNIFSSSLTTKIYNIQDGDKQQKYRAIQNKQGKMGLCKVGRLKLKKILSFDYDALFMIHENSYICKKDGKYGIYNTEINKMLVSVLYDDIYAIKEDSVELVKDDQVHCFTHKGYRIVK